MYVFTVEPRVMMFVGIGTFCKCFISCLKVFSNTCPETICKPPEIHRETFHTCPNNLPQRSQKPPPNILNTSRKYEQCQSFSLGEL